MDMTKKPTKLISLKDFHFNKSSWLLIVSFSLILFVTYAALALISLQIKETQSSINEIVASNNKKSQLLVEMQQAARERSLALYSMVNTRNSKEYERMFSKFESYADNFNNAREKLLSMKLSEVKQIY